VLTTTRAGVLGFGPLPFFLFFCRAARVSLRRRSLDREARNERRVGLRRFQTTAQGGRQSDPEILQRSNLTVAATVLPAHMSTWLVLASIRANLRHCAPCLKLDLLGAGPWTRIRDAGLGSAHTPNNAGEPAVCGKRQGVEMPLMPSRMADGSDL
jgi:hypothetical protein